MTAPEHIWLLDYGSGECVWCNCPAPDAEDHEPVKYVRADLIEALTRVQPSTSSVEAVARAIDPKAWERRDADLARRDEWEREIKVGWGDVTFEQWADRFIGKSLEQAHRVLAALPSPEREPMREALVEFDDGAGVAYTIGKLREELDELYRREPPKDAPKVRPGRLHDVGVSVISRLQHIDHLQRYQIACLEHQLAVDLNPPKHKFWGAGEPDCPREIKAGNGELHTLRCKVCGQDDPRDDRCLTANPATIRDTDEDAVEADMRAYAEAAMQHGWKTAVDAAANGRLVDGWERDWFEQNPPKCARLASSTPAEPREASGYCPFCMTADPVAPAEGDAPTAEGNYDERN